MRTVSNSWNDLLVVSSNSTRFWLIASVLILGLPSLGRADECSDMLAAFNETVDAGRDADAQLLVDKIATHAFAGKCRHPCSVASLLFA